jgi:flagellar motor switch/type III secretory pathway protein FliN
MSSSLILSSSSDALALVGPAADDAPIDLTPMLDVRCAVDFVLGTGTVTMRECLRLQRHSVIRLIQREGADLSVSVRGVTIATGEVVIIDDSTALRISHVRPPPGLVETA